MVVVESSAVPTKEQYRKNPAKYRRQRREYYELNRRKSQIAVRKWRKKNRERHRAYQRNYYRKHREKAQDYQKRWYRENRKVIVKRAGKWSKRNPEKRKKIRRQWEQTLKGRINKQKNTAKRRARTKTGGTLTDQQWQRKLKRFDYRCARCRRRRKLELHHIIPLASGGRNVIRNVRPLCKSCHIKTHRELKAKTARVSARKR